MCLLCSQIAYHAIVSSAMPAGLETHSTACAAERRSASRGDTTWRTIGCPCRCCWCQNLSWIPMASQRQGLPRATMYRTSAACKQTVVTHRLRTGAPAASNAARRSRGTISQTRSGTRRKNNGVARLASSLCARPAPSNDLRMKVQPGSCILTDATSAWRSCVRDVDADAAKKIAWKVHSTHRRCSTTKLMAQAWCVRFARARATPSAITLHTDAHAVVGSLADATSMSRMSRILINNRRGHYNAGTGEK